MNSHWGAVGSQYRSQSIAVFFRSIYITPIFVFLILLISAAPGSAKDPVRIGVWALNGKDEALAKWNHTVTGLNEQIPDRTFELTPLNYEELIGAIKCREVDFAIIDPALYIQLETEKHIQSIATLQVRYKGCNYAASAGTILCLKDRSDLHSPLDLKGKRLVSTDSRAFADWICCLREFKRLRFQPSRDLQSLQFMGNNKDTINAVLNKQADAAAVSAGTLERLIAEGEIPKNALKVLSFPNITHLGSGLRMPPAASTRTYPDWCFASVTRTPLDFTKQVAAALLNIPGEKDAIPDRPTCNGWLPPQPNICTHQCLQELRMYPYEEYGETSVVEFVREYMYWFIAMGAIFVLLIVIDLYVMALNRALAAEIKERKQAELALRESVRRFEHIASCSADWIWETDVDGRYTYSSSIVHQMLGYDASEVLGKHPMDLFATAERERLKAEGQPALATGKKIFRERYRMLTKDGRVVIHESTAEPVYNEQGELVGYRGVNRDITDKVRFVRLRL